jgi:probable F420-dependent oxidoreductase
MRFWAGVAFVDLDEVVDVARACDTFGYAGVMVSDHLVFPADLSSPYPYTDDGRPSWSPDTPWPDPWVLIGALSAVTTRLRFATNIYVAASRHPVITAKAVATASVLSGGRVALGVGAGWMREEFSLLGTSFADRGRRLDELVEVLRLLWSGQMVEWDGPHYKFDALQVSPAPSGKVPIWGGGHSDAALRRAARLDGWIGNAYTPEEAESHLSRLTAYRRAAGTLDHEDYEVIIGLMARPDVDLYRRFADLGVTGLLCAPWITSRAQGGGGAAAAVADRTAAKAAAIEEFATRFVAPLAN